MQRKTTPMLRKSQQPTTDVDGGRKVVSDMESEFRVAAIVTSFFPNSHAGVLVSKFLRGFPTDDGLIAPRVKVASLFIDQIHQDDIGLQLAQAFDVPVFESIRSALTLGGTELSVDAVLIIGEHGDYPRTYLGQEMLPRRYFFEQVCGVIAEYGRPIPVYSDKHLAYRWQDAQWMYETAGELGVPLWAGSALPVAWRRPNWEHPIGQPLDEAVSIGFHMLERYGFHGLECLQCQVERRAGFETGVNSVQCLSGSEVWHAAGKGRWSWELAERALSSIVDGPEKLEPERIVDPHVFLIDYRDGLKAAVLMLGDNGYVRKFAYASRRGSSIDALEYHTDTGSSHAVFSYMGLNIEDFFLTGVQPSPLERTYLTTGILEAVMISHGSAGHCVETPHLAVSYAPGGNSPRRPDGPRPHGASLEPWILPAPGATPAAVSIPITNSGTIRGKQFPEKKD